MKNGENNPQTITSEAVDKFIEFCEYCSKSYAQDKLVEKEMNGKQCDLLHDLELKDLKSKEIATVGKELRNLRQHRRTVKDEILLADPVYTFLNSHLKLIDDLKSLSLSIQKVESFLGNRVYNVRSSAIDIGSIDSNCLKDDKTRLAIILNESIKKWSKQSNVEEACENNADSVCNLGNFSQHYWLSINNIYSYGECKNVFNCIAKSVCNGFRQLYENISYRVEVSEFPIDNVSTMKSTLKATSYIINQDKVIFTLNGEISEITNIKPLMRKSSKHNKKGKKK